MSKEKEPQTIADFSDEMTEEQKKRHEDQKVKHPQWKPSKAGQNINAYVDSINVMQDFNGKDKHATLMVLRTTNETYPIVSFFPNSICMNQFEKFTANKTYGKGFEALKESLSTLQGRTFNILYNGEKESSQKGFAPYKDFSIIETTGR